MSYRIVVKKQGKTPNDLIEDLLYVLRDNEWTIDFFGVMEDLKPQRGLAIACHRGNQYNSFSATRYKEIDETTGNIGTGSGGRMTEPEVFETFQETGSFCVYNNLSYNQDLKYYEQESLISEPTGSPLKSVSSYQILVDNKGWNFIVITSFEGKDFFTFFGSASDGGEKFEGGSYAFGKTVNSGFNFRVYNKMQKSATNQYTFKNIFTTEYYSNDLTLNLNYNNNYNELITASENRTSSRTNKISFSSNDEINIGTYTYVNQNLKSLDNKFNGLQCLVNFEIYCSVNKDTDYTTDFKRFAKFDFGFFSAKSIRKSTKYINNKDRIDFYFQQEFQQDNYSDDGVGIFIRIQE